jgi:hypothetical protein
MNYRYVHSLRNHGRGRRVEHPRFINRFPHSSTSLLPNGYRDEIRTYFECSVNFLRVYICTVFGATTLAARVRTNTRRMHIHMHAHRACVLHACARARAAGHRTSNVDYRSERMSTRRATSRAPYMVHRKMISIHRNRRSRASAAAAPASRDARTNSSAGSMIQRDSK